MRDNPERLAWVVLSLSFFACIGLVVTVPLGARHYIFHACVGQDVTPRGAAAALERNFGWSGTAGLCR